jgi:hypothetical protein
LHQVYRAPFRPALRTVIRQTHRSARGKLVRKGTGYEQEKAKAALTHSGSRAARAELPVAVIHRFLRRGKEIGQTEIMRRRSRMPVQSSRKAAISQDAVRTHSRPDAISAIARQSAFRAPGNDWFARSDLTALSRVAVNWASGPFVTGLFPRCNQPVNRNWQDTYTPVSRNN